MATNEHAQQLHDRATRGGVLTPDEQAELKQWYEEEDRAEAELLSRAVRGEVELGLQQQVDATLDQLQMVTQRIQEVSVENDTIRREIAELRRLVAHRLTTRAA